MKSLPADLYTNPRYWQEYDCPVCLIDYDVSPIPRPGTTISPCNCGTEWQAGEGEPNTYVIDESGDVVCVTDLMDAEYAAAR